MIIFDHHRERDHHYYYDHKIEKGTCVPPTVMSNTMTALPCETVTDDDDDDDDDV